MIRKEVLGFLSTYLAIWVIFIAQASTVASAVVSQLTPPHT